VTKLPLDSPTSINSGREIQRKALHLPGLLVPYFGKHWPHWTWIGLGIVSLLYFFSEMRRIRGQSVLPLVGFFTQRLTRAPNFDPAPLFLALGLCLSTYFFSFQAAMIGALLVCVCDGLAAVLGMAYGKRRIGPLKKTYLGSGVFFVSSCLILIPWVGMRPGLAIASVGMFVEMISVKGIDNFVLPVVGSWVAAIILT